MISLVSFNYFNMASILVMYINLCFIFQKYCTVTSASPALPLFHASGVNYSYICSTCHHIPVITKLFYLFPSNLSTCLDFHYFFIPQNAFSIYPLSLPSNTQVLLAFKTTSAAFKLKYKIYF